MNFVAAYERFRDPKIFMVALVTFCTTWVTLNLLPGIPHFDTRGDERLSLILSIEASVAVSFQAVGLKRNAQANDFMLRSMLDYHRTNQVMIETLMKKNEAADALVLGKLDAMGAAIAEIGDEDDAAAA